MDNRDETNEDVLTFDVPDDALERAANVEQQANTLIYCNSPVALLRVATVEIG